jgi:hypothetical protein
MQNHPAIPIVACLLYGLLIVVGKKLMKNRPAFNWRNSMVRFCLFWTENLADFPLLMIGSHVFSATYRSSTLRENRQRGILGYPCSPSLGWSELFHSYFTISWQCPFVIIFAKTLRLRAGPDRQVYGYKCLSSANSRKSSICN